MQNKGWTVIKRIIVKTGAFLFSKDALVFLFFLVMSAFFWYLQTLRKTFERVVDFPLEYKNISEDILITNDLPDTLHVLVRDHGIMQWMYNVNMRKPIEIDVEAILQDKNKMVFASNMFQQVIDRQLGVNAEVLSIIPDSINVHHEKLVEKLLPVEIDVDVSLESQFILSGEIEVNPSSVVVYSTTSVLKTINKLETDRIVLSGLRDTVENQVKLKPIKGVKLAQENVQLTIPVEPFTEKTVAVPLYIKNLPPHTNIRLFPATISVSFFVGLSQYKKVSEIDFNLFVDYNDIIQHPESQLKVKEQRVPEYVKNVRISPSEVEYLIEITN